MALNELQRAFLKNILIPKTNIVDPDTGEPVDWGALGGEGFESPLTSPGDMIIGGGQPASGDLARFPEGGATVAATQSSAADASWTAENLNDGSLVGNGWVTHTTTFPQWARYTWTATQSVDRVRIYGPGAVGGMLGAGVGKVMLSDGTEYPFSALTALPGFTDIEFGSVRTVTWLEIRSTQDAPSSQGLRAVEVYHAALGAAGEPIRVGAGVELSNWRIVNGLPVWAPPGAANADTSGATLGQLETEVNQLKAALRAAGIIAS